VKVIIAAGIAAAAITLGGTTAAWCTPAASATGGPCQYAGTAQGGGANGRACNDCLIANGNNLQATYTCGVPAAKGPACEQAGVCGAPSSYRTYPCPENAPIGSCVPPGTFPTPAAPAVPLPPNGRLPNGDRYTPSPDDPWGHGN
jgi:hypothetical protein